MIALLGRRDSPTDALEDYCRWLSQALEKQGHRLALVRVPWAELGWRRALQWLWRESRQWKGQWVLLQYTALSWSRRAFPLGLLAVLWFLRWPNQRLCIVFHDPGAYSGTRLVDRIRRIFQQWIIRISYRWAAKSILTVPIESVHWLPSNASKALFIPVGGNVPALSTAKGNGRWRPAARKTIAVFGVTGGEKTPREVADIAFAMKAVAAQVQQPRLITLGRGSKEAEESLRQALTGAAVDSVALGILSPEEISATLAGSDALLFVREHVSTQRGSAMAGIACGVPLVGYAGPHTGPPLTEAGVLLVPQGDRDALSKALLRALTDEQLWRDLHLRSLRAQQTYFSWGAIAKRYIRAFEDE